jgi:hypothetical protein
MFLLVGWLAPMPPASPEKPAKSAPPAGANPVSPAAAGFAAAASPPRAGVNGSRTTGKPSMTDVEIDASNRRTAWTIGIVVVVLLVLATHGARQALGLLRLIS